ncbi:MAG: APC family permease [Actinomycetota bacterium]
MQGIATIAPAFAILAAFVFILGFAGIVTPWAYIFGGALLALEAIAVSQLAKAFPSAGGWYTWIARALHPRAGFFAGVLFSIWLPPVGALTLSFLGKLVLEPSIKAEYGVTIPWWVWVVAGLALVAWTSYRGIVLSERLLITTGLIEIAIMVLLGFFALANPGKGGFTFAPLNPAHFGLAGNLFLGVVFSIFGYSGWEAAAPLAEESKNPRRNVPIALVGSVVIFMLYVVFVTWAYIVGIGTDNLAQAADPTQPWPVAALAQRVWGGAWVLLLFALLNSAIAVSIACFNGGTRTWYAMGRSGVMPAAFAKVSPTRRTPDNAIHLQVAVNVLAFVFILIFGAENVFFTWANAITIGLVTMYLLANIGVIRYYTREARSQFNPILHVLVPVVASAAGLVVVWKSYFSPFPKPFTGPVAWGLEVFVVVIVLTLLMLAYLRARGNEEWLHKAQLVFEETEAGH